MATIGSTARLRELIGAPREIVRFKIQPVLNGAAQAFIARSPMAFLATCGADGMPTVSPKGDQPGFARVADERTLLIPERKGNKLIFSLQNLLENPKVGLIFLVPGTCETLRVQGSAELTEDRSLCEQLSARGSPALLTIKVQVTACYFHCAKAFLRAELWNSGTWPSPVEVSFGREIAQRGGLDAAEVAEFDAGVQARYRTDL